MARDDEHEGLRGDVTIDALTHGHRGAERAGASGEALGALALSWTDADGARAHAVEGVALVGSADGVAIRIRDPRVSRLHLEVMPHPDGVRVRDLESRNGTFSGVLRIERAVVPEGGAFRVGDTVVTVERASRPSAGMGSGIGAGGGATRSRSTKFHGLVGQSTSSRDLFALLERVAASDAPALVTGETGTGKELVARAIHDASSRRDEPFVIVDCAALPEALLEGELFGHARGAFTGANVSRAGAFEAASGGTVFLDEIGELPLSMQPKLLRVLESKTVRRLGETNARNVDVRFVAATHRDLPAMVARGTFREDLFFRLSVLPVRTAPLRERLDDLPVLLAQLEKRAGKSLPLDVHARARLTTFSWPGNVRELRNFVDRAVALGADHAFAALSGEAPKDESPGAAAVAGRGAAEAASETPDATATGALPSPAGAYRVFRDEWARAGDRAYVRALLDRHGGNVVDAAAEGQIDKSYFYRLVRREK